jgi:amidase/6-aminohexanoate-cyclic-dimer hydrolase
VNGKINAIVLDHEDVGRKAIAAGLPQGPFTGVPYLLKDLGAALKGTVTTGSLSLTRETVADADSTYVERCKKAGLVIFGKTHSPELGLSPSSESRMFGATRNPWDTTRIAGGSSGGAAAAVAAGIVPVAHATDGGGSIRIPAACCGVFGLKPTRARTPAGPKRGEGWGGMSIGHVVSRTVRDSAASWTQPRAPRPAIPTPHPNRPSASSMRSVQSPAACVLPSRRNRPFRARHMPTALMPFTKPPASAPNSAISSKKHRRC